MDSKLQVSKRKLSVRERRRRKRIYTALAYVALFACFCGLIIYLLYLPHTRIQDYSISGTQALDTDLITQDVAMLLERSAFIFPQDSYFVFSRTEIAQYLQNKYPRIKSIDVSVDSFQKLQVDITEYDTEYQAVVAGEYYEISGDGTLIEQIDTTENTSLITLYLHPDYFDATLGDQILTRDKFIALMKFVDNLELLGIDLQIIQFNNAIEYIFVVSHGEKIIIDPRDSYTTYQAVLREILPYKEFGYNFTEAAFDQEISYINLRYGKKILYCYKGEVCEGNYTLLYDE